jgi:hypothetical protein
MAKTQNMNQLQMTNLNWDVAAKTVVSDRYCWWHVGENIVLAIDTILSREREVTLDYDGLLELYLVLIPMLAIHKVPLGIHLK